MSESKALVLGILAALTISCDAQSPIFNEAGLSEVTTWMGKNSKSISGVFLEEKDGKIHVMDTQNGKIYKLDPKNLSQKTLTWFARAKAKASGKEVAGADKGAGAFPSSPSTDDFKPLDSKNLERSRIRPIDPTNYGLKAERDGPEPFVPFFMWWDQNSNLPVPRGRDFENKVQWIYKEMNKRVKKNTRYLAKPSELKEGFTDYFEYHYKDEATFTLTAPQDFTMDSLAKLTTGSSATVLRLAVCSGNKINFYVDSSLIEVKPDGSVVFIAYDKLFNGKFVEITEEEKKASRSRDGLTWKIELAPGTEIPDRMKKFKDGNFRIGRYARLFVLTPYVKPKKAKDEVDQK